MNLRALIPSRKALKPGDIFVLQIRDGEFVFGRVVRTDAKIKHIGPTILIYVYRACAADKLRVPPLDKDNLLIPPAMINRLPWSRGYFEVVEHRPLREEDVLLVHCFYDPFWEVYRDDDDRELPKRVEPCGVYGLCSYRTIGILVSKALGIPTQEE